MQPLSNDLRERILKAVDNHEGSRRKLASRFFVNPSTIACTMVAIYLRNASTGTAISFCSSPSSTMPCTAEKRLRAVTPRSSADRFGNNAASGR